ncbi:MAG: hypothetical protein IPK95_11780 [Cellvibrionales bacterium]|nr:hypothetical protein [Cellvibrionales bacterium]
MGDAPGNFRDQVKAVWCIAKAGWVIRAHLPFARRERLPVLDTAMPSRRRLGTTTRTPFHHR